MSSILSGARFSEASASDEAGTLAVAATGDGPF
jgi:hypothetical protein